MKARNSADYMIEKVTTACDMLAALTIFSLMLVIVADVAGRYLFVSPISWAHDLISWYLMPASVFLLLPSTVSNGNHINIDLFVLRLGPVGQRVTAVVGILCTLPFLALIAYFGWGRFYASWSVGETMTGALRWPTWLYYVLVPLGFSLMIISLVHKAAHTIADRPLPRRQDEILEEENRL